VAAFAVFFCFLTAVVPHCFCLCGHKGKENPHAWQTIFIEAEEMSSETEKVKSEKIL